MGASLTNDCLVCMAPLSGALGAVGRMGGIRRSPQNPNLCNRCNAHIEDGSIVELGVFFADLTGYTRLTQELGPERAHQVVDAYLRAAKEIIVKWDGFVVQFAGDEVMALFNAPLRRDDYRARAASAALDLQRAMPELSQRFGRELRATIGIASGHARMGRHGSEELKDFTAIGNVVNRAARLVRRVEPGGILVDGPLYDGVADRFPDAAREQVSLKGFTEPVEVVSLGGDTLLPAPAPRMGDRPRRLRAIALLGAIVGAPCAGLLILNPVILGAGVGAASLTGVAVFLDQPALRLPLLAVATVAAVANLVAIGWSRRPAAVDSGVAPSQAPPWYARSTLAGVAASAAALTIVGFEWVAHRMMHG